MNIKLTFKKESESSLFLEMIFFAQTIPGVRVVLERNGFLVSNQEYHTHIDVYDRYDSNAIETLKSFILSSVDSMEDKCEIFTHEDLKKKNLSSADIMVSPIKNGFFGRILWSQKQLDEFYETVSQIKKIKC